jgi:integrase
MPRKTFTDTFLRSLSRKPTDRAVIYTEPGRKGLILRHQPGGTLSWLVRYQRDGRQKWLTLGAYPALSLEAAHDAHSEARKQLAKGLDPDIERQHEARAREKQRREEKTAGGITVRNVIAEWGWRFARKHRKRPREAVRLLRVNLAPWDLKPAKDLTRRDAVTLLDKIVGRGSAVMANRIHALGLQAFTFGVSRELVPLNPFLGIPRPGGTEAPKERALTVDEIKAFWTALDLPGTAISSAVRLCLRLILATAQRPGEIIGARWSEFDLTAAEPVWLIPAARSKNGKAHEVPLSDLATELLGELQALQKEPRPCIAPSHMSKLAADESLSERALSRALRNNHDDDGKLFGLSPFTPHDLRRSAATGMTLLGIPRLHVAKVLNHADRDITSVYDRHDYASEKRAALQLWADELRKIIAGKQRKVVPIREGARA